MIDDPTVPPEDIVIIWDGRIGLWKWQGGSADELPEGEYLVYRRSGTIRVTLSRKVEELP